MTDAELRAEIKRLDELIDDTRRVLTHGLRGGETGVYCSVLQERRRCLLKRLYAGNVTSETINESEK